MKEHVRLRRIKRLVKEAQDAHLANNFVRSNECAWKLWQLGERCASAYHQFYYHHRVTRNYAMAETMISRAIMEGANTANAWHNLGLARRDQNHARRAMDAFAAALQLEPDFLDSTICFGNTAWEAGEVALAHEAWQRALILPAQSPASRYDQGCHRILMQRDFREAWQQYGARWEAPLFLAAHERPPGPAWDGSPIDSVFLFAEQGNGDAIMLLRWLPWVCTRAQRVHLAVHRPLVRLVRDNYPDVIVQPLEDPFPAYRAQASLFELPALAELDAPEHVPPAPYLKAMPVTYSRGRHRVGLCWAGGTGTAHDWRRSIPFAAIQPLLTVPVGWHVLQLERLEDFDAAQTATIVWHRDVGPLPDFAATAKALMSLNLLITVDTSIAHLAGALGVPTWLLLPRMPDFRWGIAGETSYWYPSMRLFRQTIAQEWAPVIDLVTRELEAMTLRVAA